MRITYADYVKLLKKAFEWKRVNNDLSLLLAQSAPARVRQACVHLYRKYYENGDLQTLRKDTQALNDFFGPAEHGRQFIDLINGFETDKFRPLDKYLKGHIESTDERNVELLAWLIDFKHRPYSYDKNFQLSDEELAVINEKPMEEPATQQMQPVKEKEGEQKHTVITGSIVPGAGELSSSAAIKEQQPAVLTGSPKKTGNSVKLKRAAIIGAVLVIIATGIYLLFWWGSSKEIKGNPNSICVYWQDDHYQQVTCSEEQNGRHIITMDSARAMRFKRITRPDTITAWCVGRIYYIKDSNNIKYYTEGGNYPEDEKRDLKKLSQRIFEKYVLNKTAEDKNPLAEKN